MKLSSLTELQFKVETKIRAQVCMLIQEKKSRLHWETARSHSSLHKVWLQITWTITIKPTIPLAKSLSTNILLILTAVLYLEAHLKVLQQLYPW